MNPLLKKLGESDHGRKAEKRTAKRLSGNTQPGSGCRDHSKGDIKLGAFLLENKSTVSESLSVKLAWLKKIADEAVAINREPALSIQFVDSQGRPVPEGSWVAIPERVFRELTEG